MTSPVTHPSNWPSWLVFIIAWFLIAGLGLIVWEAWTISWARYHWKRSRRGHP